jgi:hypothetical protein
MELGKLARAGCAHNVGYTTGVLITGEILGIVFDGIICIPGGGGIRLSSHQT